jgi:hypothetical protein
MGRGPSHTGPDTTAARVLARARHGAWASGLRQAWMSQRSVWLHGAGAEGGRGGLATDSPEGGGDPL